MNYKELKKKELIKKIENLHISLNKKNEKIKFQKIEITNLLKQKEELKNHLGLSNATVYKQMKHIEMLNNQLDIQDKAIIRKDEQFKALKKLYKDDLINGALG